MKTIMKDETKFLEVALGAVKKAEPIFREYFGNVGTVHTKGDNPRNWVTDADRAIEKIIVSEITRNFPNHSVVGEEFSPKELHTKEYAWYIDPIDGTSQYIHGIPFCCISIGCSDAEGPLIGVISNPETGELFSAVRGKGAFKNGTRISVSDTSELPLSFGSLGWGSRLDGSGFFSSLIPSIGKIRVLGSSALQLCLLAEGKFDFYAVTGVFPWDIAAGVLIANEGGARITNFHGDDYTFASSEMLATNGHIHKGFLDALAKTKRG